MCPLRLFLLLIAGLATATIGYFSLPAPVRAAIWPTWLWDGSCIAKSSSDAQVDFVAAPPASATSKKSNGKGNKRKHAAKTISDAEDPEARISKATRALQLSVVLFLLFFHFELFSGGFLCRYIREAVSATTPVLV